MPSYNNNTFASFNVGAGEIAENKFLQLFKGATRTPNSGLTNSLTAPFLLDFGNANDLALEVTRGAKIGGQLYVGSELSVDGTVVASGNISLDSAGDATIGKSGTAALTISTVEGQVNITAGGTSAARDVVIGAQHASGKVDIESLYFKSGKLYTTGDGTHLQIDADHANSWVQLAQWEAQGTVLRGVAGAGNSVVAAANQALTLTSNGTATWSASFGDLTVSAAAAAHVLGGVNASLKATTGSVTISAIQANGSVIIEDMNVKANALTGGASTLYVNAADEQSIIFQTEATGGDLAPALTIDKDKLAAFSGAVTVAGNLTVNGTTTTINTTNLSVEDANIEVASGATNSSEANGAGLTVAGAAATLLYVHDGAKWAVNKPLDVTGNLHSTAQVSGASASFTNAMSSGSASITNACTAGSLSDGTATLDDGSLSSVVNIGLSGTISGGTTISCTGDISTTSDTISAVQGGAIYTPGGISAKKDARFGYWTAAGAHYNALHIDTNGNLIAEPNLATITAAGAAANAVIVSAKMGATAAGAAKPAAGEVAMAAVEGDQENSNCVQVALQGHSTQHRVMGVCHTTADAGAMGKIVKKGAVNVVCVASATAQENYIGKFAYAKPGTPHVMFEADLAEDTWTTAGQEVWLMGTVIQSITNPTAQNAGLVRIELDPVLVAKIEQNI